MPQRGRAPAAIADDLEARFGPAVRGVPPTTGVGAIFWAGLGLADLD
jgi:cytochrome c-type biogenesis protein CcmH/NrfF